jgi:hypothetical protein
VKARPAYLPAGGLPPEQETLYPRVTNLERLGEVLSATLEVLLDGQNQGIRQANLRSVRVKEHVSAAITSRERALQLQE